MKNETYDMIRQCAINLTGAWDDHSMCSEELKAIDKAIKLLVSVYYKEDDVLLEPMTAE